jgi:hypothetical protein
MLSNQSIIFTIATKYRFAVDTTLEGHISVENEDANLALYVIDDERHVKYSEPNSIYVGRT